MKKQLLLLVLSLFMYQVSWSQGNDITGKIIDSKTNEALIGASISVIGDVAGTVSNADGGFKLSTKKALPFKVKVSMIGYQSVEQEITKSNGNNISLAEFTGELQDVVVTGNRVDESITKAAVTIERLGAKQLQQSPASDVYFSLQSLKGVDLLTQSLGFKSVNMRGFGANNNNRFVQLTDGMDNRSPGFGFGFGNVAGISDLDIESVEILPGASSALYGPDALQGIMLTKSKSPFEYQGLSASLKTGVNNIGKSYMGAKLFTDFGLRYAQQLSNRFAFKVNFQMLDGTDFIADDYSDRSHRGRPGFFKNDAASKTTSIGFVPNNDPSANLAYDGVNIYGDDFNNGGSYTFPANYSKSALAGKTVTRTGYTEMELMGNNGNIYSKRANVSLYYKINSKVEANVGWYYGNGNFIRTAGFREYYPDYKRNQFKLELKGDEFFIRGYNTLQQLEGYNLGALAQRILNIGKTASAWGNDFGTNFNGDITAARNAADANKLVAGSDAFNVIKDKLINTNSNVATSYGVNGVRLLDNSSMYHTEGMYNFKKILPERFELITGASFRRYLLTTEGTVFPRDKNGKEFTINEYGSYAQGSTTIKITDGISFKPTVAVRYDKNQYFKGGFTPRFSGVLTAKEHNFRASWQSAFRNPSPNQLLSDGSTGEVGGSATAVEGANLVSNPAYLESSVLAYRASITAANPNGNEALLTKYTPNPSAFGTEKVKTWEVGYKTLIANKFYFDAFYFSSIYNDFIATQNYIQPKSGKISDLKQGATSNVYALNFNNFNTIFVNGFGLGLEYGLPKGYTITANFANQVGKVTAKDNFGNTRKDAYGNEIIKRKMSNPEVSAVGRNFFISPENRLNIGFSNPKVTKNIGFNVNFRWTDKTWVEQGTTAGDIWLPAWTTLDAAVSVKVPTIKSVVKFGGSNILNKYYAQGYGIAQIGAMYYVQVLFSPSSLRK